MTVKGGNSGLAALPYTVIRIRAGDQSDQRATHYGTGFFYELKSKTNSYPVIVSNKHVICGKLWLEFDFGLMNDEKERALGAPFVVRVDRGQLPIFEHPDPSVDLAAIPLLPMTEAILKAGKTPYPLLLNRSNNPSTHVQSHMHAATSVLMVGFPNGIMDHVNNLPVVRRGTLATPYSANYLGMTNFVVDIAAFGGSSGSPIFSIFEYPIADERGMLAIDKRAPDVYLIGVLHSGPTMSSEGKIVPMPVPTNFAVVRTDVMIHLGYCVKAFRIDEILPVAEAYAAAHPGP